MTKNFLLSLSVVLSLGSVSNMTYAKPKEKTRVYHVCTSKDSPENTLACAMYFEARSEGYKGMLYVGNVILNRRSHDEYPDKISKVVYQRHQFSYISKRGMKIYDQKSWKIASQIAKKLLSTPEEKRRLTDPTMGAIFFTKRGKKVTWSKKMVKTISYKKHVFYKEK